MIFSFATVFDKILAASEQAFLIRLFWIIQLNTIFLSKLRMTEKFNLTSQFWQIYTFEYENLTTENQASDQIK